MPRTRTRIIPLQVGSSLPALAPPTRPASASPYAAGTTSVSLTWTHPGVTEGVTYALTVTDATTGATITPSSGSGLGPYVVPVSDGLGAIATLTATRTADSQQVPALPYSIVVNEVVPGGWTKIGDVNFVGSTTQTFTTTGDKTVTLANSSTVTVNATMSVGTITTGTAGSNSTRGLIADVPASAGSTAYRLRVAVPVSPAVGSTDDLLVQIETVTQHHTLSSTGPRTLWGLTVAGGSEASAEFSGVVLQGATSAVKLQSRKGASPADITGTAPTTYYDGSTVIVAEVRVVGKARTAFVTPTSRLPDSGTPTYTADIGGDSSGPNTGLEAPLFSGSTIYVQFYNWNGGASGPQTSAAIRRIRVFERATSRVP
jgi:hypothetical protein